MHLTRYTHTPHKLQCIICPSHCCILTSHPTTNLTIIYLPSAPPASHVQLPISGKRIPAIINKRLNGYVPGHQQFDYPAHNLRSRGVCVSFQIMPIEQPFMVNQ